MIKLKLMLASLLVAVSLVGTTSQPASAASCSNKAITQVSSATRTLSWERKDIGSGDVIGTGSTKTRTSVYYADCGDNNSKVTPTYIKMCLLSINISNDPFFTGIRPTLTMWDNAGSVYTNDYLHNLTSAELTTTVGDCTYYNDLQQQYNPNGSVYWYAISKGPSWSYYLFPNKTSDQGIVPAYSSPEKYLDPVNDPYEPIY